MRFRLLLYPFGFIYGLITYVRRQLYAHHIIKCYHPATPTICVGNLSMGGTGKTPHTEYLIRLLSPDYQVATLSRGYKRKTKGFINTKESTFPEISAPIIGDEPMQFYSKFPQVTVAVAENRQIGIEQLSQSSPKIDVIILDDAYQHLAVKAQHNILITEYANPYCNDYPVPAGNLREFRCAAKYADMIIVSKTPEEITLDRRLELEKKLKLTKEQFLFFSSFCYQPLLAMNKMATEVNLSSETKIVLLTGIANPKPLINYLSEKYEIIKHYSCSDHHHFSEKEISTILKDNFKEQNNTIIVTTEKDMMRLNAINDKKIISLLPIFVIPIEVKILFEEENIFNKIIRDYVRQN